MKQNKPTRVKAEQVARKKRNELLEKLHDA